MVENVCGCVTVIHTYVRTCILPTYVRVYYQHMYVYITNICTCILPTHVRVYYQHMYVYITNISILNFGGGGGGGGGVQ